MALKDTDYMPLIKYGDRKLIDVPPGYLLWLYDNGLRKGDLRDYIHERLDILRQKAKEAAKTK